MISRQDDLIERLYKEYFEKLLHYAEKVLLDHDRAQDVVQDTFCEALKQKEILANQPNPGGWLIKTVKFKLRESERERLQLLRHFCPLDDISVPDTQSDPAEQISETEAMMEKVRGL